MTVPDFSAVEAAARSKLDAQFAAREKAIANGRRVIQLSAKAIRSGHRRENDLAERLLEEAKELLEESGAALARHPDINPGILNDAAKEYAEARLYLALADGGEIPSEEDLGGFVHTAPYLKGLGEAVGELRRRLLDLLRSEEFGEAERLLAVMDEAVDLLASLDYPDGMTGGLRRTTDAARSLVERSRADLTSALVAERLRGDLRSSRT